MTATLKQHVGGSAASFQVLGLNELVKTLEGLDDALQRRGQRKMLGRGGVIMAREMRKEVPQAKTPGHNNRTVKKRIGHRVFKARLLGSGNVKAGVNVGRPRLRRGDKGGWGTVLAAGSQDRYTQAGAYRGRVQKNPFVKRGFARAAPQLLPEMAATGKKFIERETGKLRRRHTFSLSGTVKGAVRAGGLKA